MRIADLTEAMRPSRRRLHAEAFEDLRDSGWVIINGSTATRSNVTVVLDGVDPMEIDAGFRAVDGAFHRVAHRAWYADSVDHADTAAGAVARLARLARFAFLVNEELVRRGIRAKFDAWGSSSCVISFDDDDVGYMFVHRITGELGTNNTERGNIQTDDPSDAADWLTQDRPSVT